MNQVVLVKVDLEGNWPHQVTNAFESVEKAVEGMNAKGYKVVTVTPLISSNEEHSDTENKSYGLGYSYTSGILIVFEEIHVE